MEKPDYKIMYSVACKERDLLAAELAGDEATHKAMFDAVCEERDFLAECVKVKDKELIRVGRENWFKKRDESRGLGRK